jgi:hypothetical protein
MMAEVAEWIFIATLSSVAIVICGAWWLFLALLIKKWATGNWS